MLHIIAKSPYSHNHLISCLRLLNPNDVLLFIEDGVYALLKDTKFSALLSESPTILIYALDADVKARGLSDKLRSDINLIDYDQFVDLTIAHYPIQSWY